MKRRSVSVLFLVFLLTATFSQAALVSQKQSDNPFNLPIKNTIYVDDSNTQGPWNGSYDYPYQSIHDGILHAGDGDTVYVFNGVYNETVCVNKSIYLRGQQQDTTIIDGQNNGSVVNVISDNVYIRRFTIRNSGGYQGNAGVSTTGNTATITECTIYRTRAGISVQNSSETSITFCRFHTNGYGILADSSVYETIDSCVLYHNGIGAYFYETQCITITNSYADTNGIGILCEKSSNILISKSAARDNDDNEGGIFFSDCLYVTVSNCHLSHNGIGIDLVNSSSCYIDQCNFSLNTHFACRLQEAVSSIIVTNSIFTENLRYGIYAINSACTVSWCNFVMDKNYGLFAKTSAINAGYNWWGSLRGPAHTGLTKADRGTLDPRAITYTPWLTFPMPGIGPDWDLDKIFQKPSYTNPWPEHISFSDPDTDGDGAPDWWELKWGYNPNVWDDQYHLDPDNDALNNIEECYMDSFGANPFAQDVFLEIDCTQSTISNMSNKPPEQEVTQMIDAFANHNITLHVDTGELGGGEELPPQSYVTDAEIVNLYWDYFLHNDLNNPRQRIFHYGIICDYSGGPGFSVMGWDHLNAFIIGAQFLTEKYTHYPRMWLAMTSAMHEVGHTFGLVVTKFNGIDNHLSMKPMYKEFWIYLPYKSILNYFYTFFMMDFSDGTHGPGDYDDWGNLDFSFFKNTTFEYPIS
jgi:parallel beta-helix repeat protein